MNKDTIQESKVQEWKSLHDNHEKYEQYALLIKLLSITITVICLALSIDNIIFILLLSILWIQEGIWKTFQARVSDRIEKIEQSLLDNQMKFNVFQFYSEWSESRPNALLLVLEYLKNALKPTVAFPYVPLMLITLIA